MNSPTASANERTLRTRTGPGAALVLCVGLVLAMSANAACAAALGSLTTSIGMLAAVAALFVIKGWPTHLPASAVSTAGGALLIAGGAAWLFWRAGMVGRVAALAGGQVQGGGSGAASIARARAPTPIALPAGVEREALLAELRAHFVRVQHAWDHAEMTALRALTTPEMLDELCLELPGSDSGGHDRSGCTEVVTLRAELLGFESLAQVFVVSIEFSGLLRESAEAGAVPFRELWLLTRSKHETTPWRLARHQALI